jgi:hypothetical protein
MKLVVFEMVRTGWKRIYNPEMAGFKISWFWPSTKSYYI